jgi:hydroxymethylpyrimidine pyrophosphatase-like HAD family hydrolase
MIASTKSALAWNDQLRMVLSDVDETIADLYRPAEQRTLTALSRLLEQGIALVLITGQSVDNVEQRVVLGLPAPLRRHIAVGACSGAELWGYARTGKRNESPYYTAENILTARQKKSWRAVVQQLIREFHLSPSKPVPIADFKRNFGDEPLRVMLDDRGPQITFEFPNAFRLSAASCEQVCRELGIQLEGYDLREPISLRAQQLLEAHVVPVTARMAGMFALDLAISGIDKSRAVQQVFSPTILDGLGLGGKVPVPNEIEIWGDRFSRDAGTDWLMCKPVDRSVRAISFRDEDPKEFPEAYNIRLWDGTRRLHAGLLEFLEGQQKT